MCAELQTMWDVWEGPAQSGRIHSRQKVREQCERQSQQVTEELNMLGNPVIGNSF